MTADGAELLSRLADGALRDGLSLLDQCAAAGGTVDSRAVLEALGLAGNLQTARLMERSWRRDARGPCCSWTSSTRAARTWAPCWGS